MMTESRVRLIGVNHEYQAAVIAAALQDHGIESSVVGGAIGDFRAECPGMIEVFVNESDASAAQEIVDGLSDTGEQIDWENFDVGAPEGDAGLDPAVCAESATKSTMFVPAIAVILVIGFILQLIL